MWDALNTGEYKGGPALTENDYCVDCVLKLCKGTCDSAIIMFVFVNIYITLDENENSTSNKEKRILLQELAENGDQKGFWISKDWFRGRISNYYFTNYYRHLCII